MYIVGFQVLRTLGDKMFKKQKKFESINLPGMRIEIDSIVIYLYYADHEYDLSRWNVPESSLNNIYVRCQDTNKIYWVQPNGTSVNGWMYLHILDGDRENLLEAIFPHKFQSKPNSYTYSDNTYVNINKLLQQCDDCTKSKLATIMNNLDPQSLIHISYH